MIVISTDANGCTVRMNDGKEYFFSTDELSKIISVLNFAAQDAEKKANQ